MKKILAVAAIVGAVGTYSQDTHAFGGGHIEMGTEIEDYNTDYDGDDFLLPFIAGKINPIEGSPWSIESKYSYRYRTDKDRRSGDKRQRFELYTGYGWKSENFAFTPKTGFRHEEFDDTAKSITTYRFYPNMSYKVNDDWSVFLSGFSGFRTENNASTKDEYVHEYDSGVRYRLPNAQQLQVSVYSEYANGNGDAGETTEEWQLRLRYNHKMENGKTTVSPWARIGLDRETRKSTEENDRDRIRHRFGLTVSHKSTDTFTVFGEVNWQTERVEGYDGVRGEDKQRTFYKLGFRQAF